MSQAGADFSYYAALRQYQSDGVDTWDAVVFSRAFADLATRCLAARAAQSGAQAQTPDLLGLPALRACLAARTGGDFAAAFAEAIPGSWRPDVARELAALAAWLADGFQAHDPLSYSYQVWVGYESEQTIQLYGPTQRPEPPAPYVQLAAGPQQAWLKATRHFSASPTPAWE